MHWISHAQNIKSVSTIFLNRANEYKCTIYNKFERDSDFNTWFVTPCTLAATTDFPEGNAN
jgi:hypothetical protein